MVFLDFIAFSNIDYSVYLTIGLHRWRRVQDVSSHSGQAGIGARNCQRDGSALAQTVSEAVADAC